VDDPKPLLPFALDLAGTGTLSAAFTANLDCGSLIPLGTTGLANIGDTVMTSTLTLTTTFTRQPDPPPTNQNTSNTTTSTQTQSTTTTTTTKVTPVQCVVPKLKGLKLAKARKAATKAHCAVGKVKRKHSAKKATTVLKQGAKAGSVLAQGSKIALTVAK
jgi:PASTA domain-containing protein